MSGEILLRGPHLQTLTEDRYTSFSQQRTHGSCLHVLFPLATQNWFHDSVENISDLYVMPGEESAPRGKCWSLLHRGSAGIDPHGQDIKTFLILMQCVSRHLGNLLTENASHRVSFFDSLSPFWALRFSLSSFSSFYYHLFYLKYVYERTMMPSEKEKHAISSVNYATWSTVCCQFFFIVHFPLYLLHWFLPLILAQARI